MKRLIFLLLPLLLFVSCAPEYVSSRTPAEIADRIENGLQGKQSFRNLDNKTDYFGNAIAFDDALESFSLRVASDGSNLDEFAVFACRNEAAAKELSKRLEEYLASLYRENREWYLSYIPEEIPKLRDAEVGVFGRYAVYAILSADRRQRALDLAREALLK